MLHAIPKVVRINGKEVVVRLIAGVATDPRYRGRGLSKMLMSAAERALVGTYAFTLVPADRGLVEFYRKQGFVPLVEITAVEFRVDGAVDGKKAAPMPGELKAIYDRWLEGSNCVLRSERDMALLIEESHLTGMFLAVAGDSYAFGEVTRRAVTGGGSGEFEVVAVVTECVGEVTSELLCAIKSETGAEVCRVCVTERNVISREIVAVSAESMPPVMVKFLDGEMGVLGFFRGRGIRGIGGVIGVLGRIAVRGAAVFCWGG